MKHPLGRYIRSRRQALGLTQQALATALGVTRTFVVYWESGDRAVPIDHFPRLAELLGVTPDALVALSEGVPRARCIPVRDCIAPDPIKCSLESVRSTGPAGQRLYETARATLGEGQFDELRHHFLRDTPSELLLGLVVLADTAAPLWTSPLQGGSRLFVPGEDKRSYEGHLLRLSIVWERDDERMIFFPQVWVAVPNKDARYRVDYVVVHSRHGELPKNVVVELDDRGHELQSAKDAERTTDLRLSVVRFDNHAVLHPEFLPRLLRAIRERADYLRVNDTEYALFVQRKKEKSRLLQRGA